MKSARGFTLIEMLAATVILGVIITVILGPLSQLFQNTRRSDQSLQATTQAQELVEQIRGQWQSYPDLTITNADGSTYDANKEKRDESTSRYDKTCYTSLPTVAGLTRTIEVRALDRNAAAGSVLTLSTSCSTTTASTSPPPMKRVSVTVKTADGNQSLLTLDIPRP